MGPDDTHLKTLARMRRALPDTTFARDLDAGVSGLTTMALEKAASSATVAATAGRAAGLLPAQLQARVSYAQAARARQSGSTAAASSAEGAVDSKHDPWPHITARLPALHAILLRHRAAAAQRDADSIASVLARYAAIKLPVGKSVRALHHVLILVKHLQKVSPPTATPLPSDIANLLPAPLAATILDVSAHQLTLRRVGWVRYSCGACGREWPAAVRRPDVTTSNASQAEVHRVESPDCAPSVAACMDLFRCSVAPPLAEAAAVRLALQHCDGLRGFRSAAGAASIDVNAHDLATKRLLRDLLEASEGTQKAAAAVLSARAWHEAPMAAAVEPSVVGSSAGYDASSPPPPPDGTPSLRARLLRESAALTTLLRDETLQEHLSNVAASLLRLVLKREQDVAVAAAGGVAGAMRAAAAGSALVGATAREDHFAAIARNLDEEDLSDEEQLRGGGAAAGGGGGRVSRDDDEGWVDAGATKKKRHTKGRGKANQGLRSAVAATKL